LVVIDVYCGTIDLREGRRRPKYDRHDARNRGQPHRLGAIAPARSQRAQPQPVALHPQLAACQPQDRHDPAPQRAAVRRSGNPALGKIAGEASAIAIAVSDAHDINP
jgi:hypothetical protein